MKISNKKIFLLFIFVIFILFILVETISYATYQTGILKQDAIEASLISKEELSEEERQILELINQYRLQNGLDELKIISKLQDVAYLKADDLVENEYFSHTSETLGTPFEMLQLNGVTYKVAGENLAGNINAKSAVEAWINSESHKENILDKDFEYTGIAVIDSPVYGKVYVELFIGI